jgi:signal transduction histidine kinase
MKVPDDGCAPGYLDEMPPVAHKVARLAMFVLAAISVGADHGWPHPGLVVLMLVALVPWMHDPIWDRPLVRAAVFLTPITFIMLFGYDLKLFAEVDHGQATLMVMAWFIGEFSTTTPPRLHFPVAAVAAGIVLAWGASLDLAGDMFGWLIGLGVALAVGTMLRVVLISNVRLRAAQAQLAQQAAVEERTRIAREVHDVVAHSLTVTMLHVTAARMALPNNPSEAREALEEAERHGRRSLADIRRTVGLLRGDGTDASTEVLPGIADLAELVADYRGAGVGVTLDDQVEPATLAPTAELAAFRVVQEALANSVKHAPGASVEVELRHDGPAVAIVVRDRGGRRPAPDGARTDGGGMGLVGMRERVAQASGTLEAGPADDGWEVVARFTATSDAPANRSVVHPAT